MSDSKKKRISPLRAFTLTPEADRLLRDAMEKRPKSMKNASDAVSICIEIAVPIVLENTSG